MASVSVASAGPIVAIRARTQLSLASVHLREDGLAAVHGKLTDRFSGVGLASQRVTVKVGDSTGDAYTLDNGTFEVDLPVTPGTQKIILSYRGGADLEAADPLTVTTDPSRAQVTLTIVRGDDATPKGATLTVRAMADDNFAALPLSVSVGPAGTDSLKPYDNATSGTAFTILRSKIGTGSHRVHVEYKGDDVRQAATADATIELVSTTTTTLQASAGTIAHEDDIVATAKVTDDDGKPVAHANVTLSATTAAGSQRLQTGLTDDKGSFEFKVEAEVLGPGPWSLGVLAEPGTAFVKPSRSNPVTITIAQPQPVPVSFTIIGFLAAIAAAGGFFLARAKPWERFRRPAPAARLQTQASIDAQLTGGLVSNKPSIVSTLRRAVDDGFSGVVRDTVRGRAVADAMVRLTLGTDVREASTNADGSFAIEQLPVGEWTAEVGAPGHVTEKFNVSIPHRGELRDVRVDLVPVREKVFQLYRRAAEPVLPDAKLWGVWSPRQIVDHVKARRPSPALSELTDFVEELYFSSRLAAETVLPFAAERVDRAVRERART